MILIKGSARDGSVDFEVHKAGRLVSEEGKAFFFFLKQNMMTVTAASQNDATCCR